ncbi:MAG TPA: hypothetical protein VM238_19055 [Phycisphaerae bacterium]|nr:hypothetical protein [Phycisphaerae bacterium]
MRRVQPAARRIRRTGFTLVELVTAASLMTVIMLGVVQVFAIVTRTAAQAEGIHFAQQQMRAVFNRLHNDLRGVTREGYLRINLLPATDPTVPSSPQYHRDTLAFTAIGRCASTFAAKAFEATAAEVVYTSNVRTPNTALTVQHTSGSSNPVDARRGILGRGQWLMAGGPAGTAHELQDTSMATYLCDMFENQQRSGGGSDDRISRMGTHLQVYPWTAIEGLPQHPETLKRVMASCVSEFYVETFNPPAGGGGGIAEGSAGGGAATNYFQNIAGTYTWRGATGVSTLNTHTWPQAIRVTIAVHDPGDATPYQQYSNSATVKPFQGFVLQEVFWLGDP